VPRQLRAPSPGRRPISPGCAAERRGDSRRCRWSGRWS